MKRREIAAVAITIALAVACGRASHEGLTTPTDDDASKAQTGGTVGQPATVAPPAQQPVADGWETTFNAFAAAAVKNVGPTARRVYAYVTSFDDQSKAIAPGQDKLIQPGAAEAFAFNMRCVQLDLSTEGHEGTPDVGFAYYDKDGQRMTSSNYAEKVAECRRGQPTPPLPSPTPTPQPSPSPTPTPQPSPSPTPTPQPSPSPTPTPAPSCASVLAGSLNPGLNDQCVVTSGGQSTQCQVVAEAYGAPAGLTYTGTEAQLNNTSTFSLSSTFAFIADANGCAQSPKQIRLFVPAVQGAPVNVTNIDGNSVTYCGCTQ